MKRQISEGIKMQESYVFFFSLSLFISFARDPRVPQASRAYL